MLRGTDGKTPRPKPDLVKAILANDAIRFGYRIGYLAQLFTGPLYKDLDARHGIGRAEWVVLFCAAHFDDLTANDIGRMSGRAKASVSRAVNKLLRLKLMERIPSLADARSAHLRLSKKGRALFESSLKAFVEREHAMLRTLQASEVKELDRLLTKLTVRDDGWDQAY